MTTLGYTEFLTEAQNTFRSDINEIQLAYFLAGQSWGMIDNARHVQDSLEQAKGKVSDADFQTETTQAKAMASEMIKWLKKSDFKGPISKIYWVARKGAIKHITRGEETSSSNPTDVLLVLADGSYLGISAKSTKRNVKPPFKNPSMGSIEKEFHIDLKTIRKEARDQAIKDFDLPQTIPAINKKLKGKKRVPKQLDKIGDQVLSDVRDVIFREMSKFSEKELKSHIMNFWFRSDTNIPYVIATGFATSPTQARATVETQNKLVDVLFTSPVEMAKAGTNSIVVKSKGRPVFAIRVKFRDKKLFSPMKMSGEFR